MTESTAKPGFIWWSLWSLEVYLCNNHCSHYRASVWYLEDVFSVRPFSLVFQQNRHVSRIDLRHTATGKLQQLRQQQRKQENTVIKKKATGLNWKYSTLFSACKRKYCNSRLIFQALCLLLLLRLLNYFSGCCNLIETSLQLLTVC